MLTTPWGDELDTDDVLQEYPRPQLVRDSYVNLNGVWEFAVCPAEQAHRPHFTQEIVVPFSPEAPLSGVGHVLQPDEYAWYRRQFTLPDDFVQDRVLLHFGAVDQDCFVWIDGAPVGGHEGGVLPFTLDITDHLHRDEHEIEVRVRDVTDTSHRSRGKQTLDPGGIWYSPASGIWQTVWLESVPAQHVTSLLCTPLLAADEVEVTVQATEPGAAYVRITAAGTALVGAEVPVGVPTRLSVPGARRWSPEDPFLHDVEVTLGDDRVTSYFGMRSITLDRDPQGRARLFLNGAPYLQRGVLDQGRWPDGLLTAPSDQALAYDVALAKSLGFTMIRKHVKVEPLRWYHHCDRIGMLVWQDMVNGGARQSKIVTLGPNVTTMRADDRKSKRFGRQDASGREEFLREVDGTVELLAPSPSVVCWVPFNEGWGQFEALSVTERIRQLDPTRLVDHASGWYDQGGGDIDSRHVYLRRFQLEPDEATGPRAVALTEYGGWSHRVPSHTWSDKEHGYKKFSSKGKFELAFHRLHRDEIFPAIEAGLAAFVYTQLSDVEEETNGLVTYDRRIVKLDGTRAVATQNALGEAFRRSLGEPPRSIQVIEREITRPHSLTLPDGSINSEAIGWSRTPRITTDGIGGFQRMGRNKRWEYWAVTTPTHIVAMTISNIDYASVLSLYTLVRETGEEIVTDATLPVGSGVELPGTIGAGRAYAKTSKMLLRADDVPAGTRLRARAGRVAFDIVAHMPEGHESLAVVVPWNEHQFQYTVKDVARPATGTIWIDDAPHDVPKRLSFATLDHGRGRWPHDVRWNWGAGSGWHDHQTIGIQVGGKWTDGSGSTENAIVVDERLHKISQELLWEYDQEDWLQPWRVHGTGVDLTFTPFHLREASTDLKLISSSTHQCFGEWSGSVDVDGSTVTFDGLTGWAEDVHNRW